MDDVFVYVVDLPIGINEIVTPCLDGYTMYLSARLTPEQREKAYLHGLRHIKGKDFEKGGSVDLIEALAHA